MPAQEYYVKRKLYNHQYVSVVYDASTNKRIGWTKWTGSKSGAVNKVLERQEKKAKNWLIPEEKLTSKGDLIDHQYSHLVSFKVARGNKTITKYVTFTSNSAHLSRRTAFKSISRWCLKYGDAIEYSALGVVDEVSLNMRLLHTMKNTG